MALTIKTQDVDKKFLYVVIPRIFLSSTISDATKHRYKYRAIEEVLKSTYHIDLINALKICCKEYSWHTTNGVTTFQINPSSKYQSISISALARLIDDGTLSVRGTNIFSRALHNLEQNLKRYYRTYILTKGQKIWQ